MKAKPYLLWSTSLILGWLFDFLFWKTPPGLNFAVYVLLCLIGGFFLLKADGQRPARRALWLLLPILFFAAVTFLRAEPLTVFLALVFTLFSMGVMTLTFLGGRWLEYSLADYVYGFLRLVWSMLTRPLMFNLEVRRAQADRDLRARYSLWPVLRGVVIALPIVALFAALLASADVIFARRLDELMRLFRLENLPEYVFRLVYILVGAYLLAGVFLHAAWQSHDETLLGQERALLAPFLGFTETVIILGSVIVLFTAFGVIQFRYLFGGQANISLEGYTYSEYARRGFGELVAVAFFSLVLILGLNAIGQRESEARRGIYSGLNVALAALVMVMLASAYQRLSLYESAYGYSRLRAYTHVALVWIGLLFLAVVVLEILRRQRAFAAACLLASLGFTASLALLNVDGFIVRENIRRAAQGQGLDVPYLASLSADAVPVLAEMFRDPANPGLTRDAAGAVLACHLQEATWHRPADWRSFTLAGWSAERTLGEVETALSGYRFLDREWPLRLLTPGGVLYECYRD